MKFSQRAGGWERKAPRTIWWLEAMMSRAGVSWSWHRLYRDLRENPCLAVQNTSQGVRSGQVRSDCITGISGYLT